MERTKLIERLKSLTRYDNLGEHEVEILEYSEGDFVRFCDVKALIKELENELE